MTACHLEQGQLWRCPVTWCAVWKGSGRACLEHLAEKHGGSASEITTNVAYFFPPWTVTRDVWHAALRPDVSGVAVDALLFHEAGSRLVHRYRVYKDPFPHPALSSLFADIKYVNVLKNGVCFIIADTYCHENLVYLVPIFLKFHVLFDSCDAKTRYRLLRHTSQRLGYF